MAHPFILAAGSFDGTVDLSLVSNPQQPYRDMDMCLDTSANPRP